MDETQSFRLIGSTHIQKLPVHQVDGENVIYWENIKQLFPGVKHVKNEDTIVPQYIKSFPGVVLNVELSSGTKNVTLSTCADTRVDPPSNEASEEELDITSALGEISIANTHAFISAGTSIEPVSSPSIVSSTSKGSISFNQVIDQETGRSNNCSNCQIHSKGINDRIDKLLSWQVKFNAKQEEVLEHQREMEKFRKEAQERQENLQMEVLERQKEMEKLQKVVLERQSEMEKIEHREEPRQMYAKVMGQLAVNQSRVQAVLTQTYELHEYPIPRLFVVLAQYPSRWNTLDPFSNKFKLYFLCECGEHTKSIDSKTEIHFAKHEGYEITRPTEFFQQYGSHVFTILKMLKFGISVAGVAVPAISHLVRTDLIDEASSYLRLLKDVEPMIDPIIDWMDKVSANEGEVVDEFTKQMENKEALAGADLRKLDTFLNVKDGEKVLGNLYRTVTDEGHVKWVCLDHFRENYQEITAKQFQSVLDSVGGSYDKRVGRVDVTLQEKQLEQFSIALGKARSVYELHVVFDYDCTTKDLEVLEEALKTSGVSIVWLSIKWFQASNLASTSSQYGVLFRIKHLPQMKFFRIHLSSSNIIRLLSIQPKTTFSHCKLSIQVTRGSVRRKELPQLAQTRKELPKLAQIRKELLQLAHIRKELPQLAQILKTNSNLSALHLNEVRIGDDGAQVLSEALKINATLITLDLRNNSIGNNGAQALSEALKTNSTLTTLDLRNNLIGDNGAQALSEALKTNSTLTTLNLRSNSIQFEGFLALSETLKDSLTLTSLELKGNKIGEKTSQSIGEALKTNSTVTTLDLYNNSIGVRGAHSIGEALKTNSTLTILNLWSNSIGESGAHSLAEALKTNSTLTTLNLQHSSIRENGAHSLGEALKTNSTLITLNLGSNSIGDSGAHSLGEALKTNSAVTTLDLHNNSIGVRGAHSLGEALKTNSTLTTLNLQYNSIGDSGAQSLGEALKTNSTLDSLDLGYNSIGESGAYSLREALKTNSTLTTLNLQYNSIRENGAHSLGEALKTNSTLTTLNLQYNSIRESGAHSLGEALKTNSTLTTLNLGGNSIGESGVYSLGEALRINSTMTTLEVNIIGDSGAKLLREATKINSALIIKVL